MWDFNIDFLKDDHNAYSWLEQMDNYQLKNIINEPTPFTAKSTSLIDHVFTSVPQTVRNTKVPNIWLSDHFPTCIVLKDSFGHKQSHTSIKFRSYKQFEPEKYFNHLMEVP